jgi:lipid-A-disaccharide synthase
VGGERLIIHMQRNFMNMPMFEEKPASVSRVAIVAGELSGELYGAHLIKALHVLNPQISASGIGGQRMREAGVKLLFDMDKLAVVGVWEVLAQAGAIVRAYFSMRRLLVNEPPDLLILIDYPDFNLRLARVAKKQNIKVLYYISPQVWAWRGGRVKKIAQLVDKMAVILPFEVGIYQQAGLDVEYVGHPLLEVVKTKFSADEAYRRYGLEPDRPVVGLLPGSRQNEIKFLLEVLLESARLVKAELPQVQFIMPVATSVDYRQIEARIARSGLAIKLALGETYEVMNVSSLLVTASGTATLEAALLGVPMVVVYKLSWLSYVLGRLLINTPYISLVNIVANKRIIPELIQYQATPEQIASCVLKLLRNPQDLLNIRRELRVIRNRLGEKGASVRTAQLAMGLIGENQKI